MRFDRTYTLQEIATLTGARILGPATFPVSGLNEIHRVEPGDLTFVDHPKYYEKALNSKASVVIINTEVPVPEGKALLVSDDPCRDFNFLAKKFRPEEATLNSRPMAMGSNVQIGKNCIFHPGVVIGNNVSIGDNCVFHPHVVIYDRTSIGNEVIVHANTTLGGDAFYYKKRPEGYDKMHSSGELIIEDRVEIGCNCCIDKGVSAITLIGKGTKIDNQVQIGHDTIIGQDCIIGSQSGIAGVTTLENNVLVWAQVGITKDVTIGEGAVIFAQSGVGKSLPGSKTYFGSPAKEARKAFKELATLSMLARNKE